MTQGLCRISERRVSNAGTPRRLVRVVRRFLLSVLLAAAHASAAVDLSGYWMLDTQRSRLDIDKSLLTDTAAERVRTFNPTQHDPVTVCMPYGMPRVMTALGAFPMEIVQTDAQITMIFDAHDEVRRVMLTAKARDASELAPLWLGYASGKWEGETLVVRTIGITDQSLVTGSGVPHSGDLVVTERIRKADANTLVNEMTLEDPQAFKQPVKRTIYYTRVPEMQQREFHCAERMWLDHVTDRAKALTRELAEKKE
jgi:hypothetical protein